MELTEYEQWRQNLIMYYLKQGAVGQRKLAMLAPLLQMYDQKYANEQANKAQARQERNAFVGQGMGIAGQLGGMYLMGRMMMPEAAAPSALTPAANVATSALTPVAGETAPTVATPHILGAEVIEPASASGPLGSVVLPAAAAAITASNLYEGGMKDILRGKGDKADWTNTALNFHPLGRMANIGLRLFGKDSLGKMMTSGKSEAQLLRDDFRGKLKEKGIVDDNYNVTLADGSKFNVGLDGKTKYTNVDGKTTRNAWDVDLNNPLAQHALQKIDPYVAEMYGNQQGMSREQYVGMLVNAATSNAKTPEEVDANIASIQGKKPATPPAQAPTQPTTPTPDPANGTIKGAVPLPAPIPAQPNPTGSFVNPNTQSVTDMLRRFSPAPQPAPAPAPTNKVGFMSTPANAPSIMPPSSPAPTPTPTPQSTYSSPQQGLLALQQAMQNQTVGQSQPSTPAQPAPQSYGSIEDLLRAMSFNGPRY